MLLLSIGLLGVAGTGLLAARLLREAEVREEMMDRAGSVLDSLTAHGAIGAGTISNPRFRLEWAASDSALQVRAFSIDGSQHELRALR